MTLEQMAMTAIACVVLIPLVLRWLWLGLVSFVTWAAPERRVEPDRVAERHRHIARGGFKSRQGIRDRRCV